MCHTHYAHFLAHGDPLVGNFHPTGRGLDAKIDKDGPNGCWLWLAAKQKDGYGIVKKDGRLQVAHRVVYETLVGPVPENLELDHLCYVEACVNPEHLEIVTRQVNLDRRRHKGRWANVG